MNSFDQPEIVYTLVGDPKIVMSTVLMSLFAAASVVLPADTI